MNRVRRHRSTQGFSLFELMITVAIVGAMAAAVMPAMTEMIMQNRQSSAATQVLNTLRTARALAFGSGLVHRVIFSPSDAGGNGSLTVQAGMGTNCLRSPGFVAVPGSVTMAEFNPDNRHRIALTAQSPLGTNVTTFMMICFQPNGENWVNIGASVAPVRQQASIVFIVERTVGGVARSTQAQIAIAPGGTPRIR